MTYTLREVSSMTGLSELTLRRRIKNGKLNARMEYGRYLIEESDIPSVKVAVKVALERAKRMEENGPLGQAPSSEHYKSFKIEPLEYIEANELGFHAGNVIKYVSRYKQKNGLDDLEKAKWYIERLIELEKGKSDES